MKSVAYYRANGKVWTHTSSREPDPEKQLARLAPDYIGYIVLDSLPPRSGGDYKVVDGKLTVIPNAKHEKHDQDKKAGFDKLKQLGVTKAQLEAMFGG